MLYTAGAFTGTQRYAATWAGDTGGGFATLTSIMNYAMCGHSNAACNIDVNSPEAIHYGFFTPWSQYFCWASWRYPWFLTPEKKEMIRVYSSLRSSLVPYIYTMAHKAYATGVSLLRPLALEFEDTDRFDDVKNEYMFGDNLLIGAFDMNLTLPNGKWIDYATGKVYEGDVAYEIPEGMGGAVLVREGSVFVTMNGAPVAFEYDGRFTEFVLPADVHDSGDAVFKVQY